ncbi:inactive polypeptide N-acetylgalactosaminyltransferase-like protein 5 [Aplysia californica]|uniref:Polypeptide N-acetylgalactosaminyltransferase n=1 Tax=Aplysia californica TaxID=6500 RepID=A0ABM0JIV5_APLCA|nr:inactive polypeptide N-acetylgalactosaminyltransferase-like protein 5 [Aplysia californica]
MRVHPRRLILVAAAAALCLLCGIIVYTRTRVSSTRLTNSIQGKLQFRQVEVKSFFNPKSSDIFWTQHSGIQRKPISKLRGKISGDFSADTSNMEVDTEDEVEMQNKSHGADLEWSALMDSQRMDVQTAREKFNLNIQTSDMIPLNREVPDSRPKGCRLLQYPSILPTTSVVIPFHNEWPSVILRTVYSLINRTPRQLLKEIILVDDASDINILKTRFRNYLDWNFPPGLVKLIRLPEREGLIRARLEGLRQVTGEVVSFFDSHMEVNERWLEPLLNEIVKNRQTIAMGQLDYINHDTFTYDFYEGYRTRYGFRWDMQFFETFFRPDQLKGKKETDPLPGVLMVGPGFAVDVNYFKHIGAYDGGMKIWGGENIELAWRAWMCGGQLLHVPCSKIGHVERSQPYTFPEGRLRTEMVNYKRAADVWLGDYRQYVYTMFPGMKALDPGSLSERNLYKNRLQCHNFTWFLENIWPELLPYQENSKHWGQVKSASSEACLDNDDYVFQAAKPLRVNHCELNIKTQGFALMKDGRLRTTLHCVVAKAEGADLVPYIENCFLAPPQKWAYSKHRQLVLEIPRLCLQVLSRAQLAFLPCDPAEKAQKWLFETAGILESLKDEAEDYG